MAGATDVMSSYPDTDEFEPTVQLAEEPEDEPDLALAAGDFDANWEDIVDLRGGRWSTADGRATGDHPAP